ncbi:MAG: SRPBCC family protein [Mycobacterium sp.]
MANVTKRITDTAAAVAMLYAARRYYCNWGATKAESQLRLPGDALVADPAIQTTEALDIGAQSSAVWPWLLQIGHGKDGFYGLDALKSFAGLRNFDADRVHPEWQHFAIGDVVRLAPGGWMGLSHGLTLNVAEIVPEKYIVFKTTGDDSRWDVVWSFHLQPHLEDRVRFLTRARIAIRHPGEVFAMELVRPLLALGARGMLLGIKHRVERMSSQDPRPDVKLVDSLGL